MNKSLNKASTARPSRSLKSMLQAFAGDRQGIIIVMFALLLPVIVGFIGLGVEVTYWFSKKRDLQAAADAAALAGSYELAENRSSNITTVATREATSNGWEVAGGPITVNNPPTNTSSSYLGNTSAVEVELSRQENLMFAGWFLSGPVTINARAVGLAVASASDACVLALGSSNSSKALWVSGASASVTMTGCSASTNSTDAAAVTTTSGLSVDCVYSAGGVSGTPTTTACSGAKENQPAVTDPYEAAVTKPADSDFASCNAYGSGDVTSADSPFCSMSINTSMTMGAGTYFIDRGDVRITGGGTVTATAGVTIVFGDSVGNDCGGITITGNSNLDITAPTSGNYAGLAIYRSSDCDANEDFNFAGNNDSAFIGAIYNPSAAINITGNGDVGGTCLQIISDTVKITGSSDIGSDCDGAGTLEMTAGGSGSLVE